MALETRDLVFSAENCPRGLGWMYLYCTTARVLDL